jgi:hypothetical protein
MYTQLMRASSERDADKVREVIKLLEYERETWSLAMKQLASEAESAASSVEPKRVPTAGTDLASQNGHSRTGSIIGSTVSIQG